METRKSKITEEKDKISFDLNNEDAWDDSLLVTAWDTALAEYKKYHSIHLQNQNIDDILDMAEAREASEGRYANGSARMESLSIENDPHGRKRGTKRKSKNTAGEEPTSPRQDDLESLSVMKYFEKYGITENQGRNLLKEVYDELAKRSQKTASPHSMQSTHSDQASQAQSTAPFTADNDSNSLRNLMMSWYYAGYYTGYHEGQSTERTLAH